MKVNIDLKLKADELKKKLNLKDGLNGKTPVKGIDYFDGQDGKDGLSIKGDPGKDGSPDTGEQIVGKINELPTDNEDLKIDAEHIKNLPEATKEIGTKAGWGAHPLRIEQSGTMKTKLARNLNFKGVGAPTITQRLDGTTDLNFPDATGTPASPDKSIQYNDAGAFGGQSDFVWDSVNKFQGIGTATPTASLDINTVQLLPPSFLTFTASDFDTGTFVAGQTLNYDIYSRRDIYWSTLGTASYTIQTGIEIQGLTFTPFYAGTGYAAGQTVNRTLWAAHSSLADFALTGTSLSLLIPTGIEPVNGTLTPDYGGSGYTASVTTYHRTIWAYKIVLGVPNYSLVGDAVSFDDDGAHGNFNLHYTWTLNPDADGYVIINDDDGTGYDVGLVSSWDDNNSVWGSPIDTSTFWARGCGLYINWTINYAATDVVIINDDTGDYYDTAGNFTTFLDDNTVWLGQGTNGIDTSLLWTRAVGTITSTWDAATFVDAYFIVNTDTSLGLNVGNVLTYSDDGTGLINSFSPNTFTFKSINANADIVTSADGYVSKLYTSSDANIGNDLLATRDIASGRYIRVVYGIGLNNANPQGNYGIDMQSRKMGDSTNGSDSVLYYVGGGYLYYEGTKPDLAFHMHNTSAGVNGFAILGARSSGAFMQYAGGVGGGFTRFRIEKSGGTLGNLATSGYAIGEIGAVKFSVDSNGAVVVGTGSTTILPLRFTSGTLLTTPLSGGMEYNNPNLFFTPGSATRYNLPLVTGAGVQGDIVYASGASIYSRLAKDTNATRYLSNTGTTNNPAWAQINLANGVTGTLGTANGGTGSTATAYASLTTNVTGILPVANGGTGSAVKFQDDVQYSGQNSDIASTNFTHGNTVGIYRVSYSLQDTIADLTAGAVVLTIAYTDGAGATTTTATQLLTGTGRQSGSVYIHLASGNIAYSTSHTGIYGSAVYALYLTLERLS